MVLQVRVSKLPWRASRRAYGDRPSAAPTEPSGKHRRLLSWPRAADLTMAWQPGHDGTDALSVPLGPRESLRQRLE
jgi:hypothetical protein